MIRCIPKPLHNCAYTQPSLILLFHVLYIVTEGNGQQSMQIIATYTPFLKTLEILRICHKIPSANPSEICTAGIRMYINKKSVCSKYKCFWIFRVFKLWFNVLSSAKVIWRREHGLENYQTDWRSKESNSEPLGTRPVVYRRHHSSSFTTQEQCGR